LKTPYKKDVYGVYRQGATEDTVETIDTIDNQPFVYGVYNSRPDQTDPQRLTPTTSLLYGVYRQPEGNPPDQPANETQPADDDNPPNKETDPQSTAGSPTDQPTNELGFAGDQMGSPTDKPATTKEERAAREIECYLRQHGEATRQDLIRLLVEKELATASSASVMLQRAIEGYLRYRLEKRVEGRHAIYRLIDESSRPSLPPARSEIEPADSPEATQPVTHIQDVTVVIRQPDQPEPTSNMCNTNNTSNNEYHVTGVTGQSEPDLQPDRRITTITSAIGVMGLSPDPPTRPYLRACRSCR
jgi:hypothetical protein